VKPPESILSSSEGSKELSVKNYPADESKIKKKHVSKTGESFSVNPLSFD